MVMHFRCMGAIKEQSYMPVKTHLRSKEMSAKKRQKRRREKGEGPAKRKKNNQQEIKPRNHRNVHKL